MLASDKHSSLLGLFVCNEESEVLWILPLASPTTIGQDQEGFPWKNTPAYLTSLPLTINVL